MRALIIVLLLCSTLAACGVPVTGARVRDNYFGRPLLEPRMTVLPPRHDAFGNPILPSGPPPQWPVYRSP